MSGLLPPYRGVLRFKRFVGIIPGYNTHDAQCGADTRAGAAFQRRAPGHVALAASSCSMARLGWLTRPGRATESMLRPEWLTVRPKELPLRSTRRWGGASALKQTVTTLTLSVAFRRSASSIWVPTAVGKPVDK